MSFNNKVVLVTGASSGIGAAIALKFAAEGAKVAIVGRNEKKLKDVSEKCSQTGSKPLVINADVSKENDVKKIISETLKHYGKLDVLINNAGISGQSSFLADNAMEIYDQVMATNLRSAVYLTYLACKSLIETKGNIINISSIAATMVLNSESSAYGASKAALDHFSRTIAIELAPKGVRVNTINPGPVKTDIILNAGANAQYAAEIWENLAKVAPLRRISDPKEVADVALFLASDKAIGVTGSSFVVDNGTILKGSLG